MFSSISLLSVRPSNLEELSNSAGGTGGSGVSPVAKCMVGKEVQEYSAFLNGIVLAAALQTDKNDKDQACRLMRNDLRSESGSAGSETPIAMATAMIAKIFKIMGRYLDL